MVLAGGKRCRRAMRQIANIKRAAGHDFSHPAQVIPVLKKPAGKFYLLDLILKAGTGGGFER